MKLISFDLTYTAVKPGHLPRFKANLIRSAFGATISRVACGMMNHSRHQSLCLFERLFEGQYQNPSPRFPRVAPFVIECEDNRTAIRAGETLALRFTLAAADFWPQVFEVWRAMGKGLAGSEFQLERVTARHPSAPDRCAIVADNRTMPQQSIADFMASEDDFERVVLGPQQLMLEFVTPCRIEAQKKPIRQPMFVDIIRAAAHRALALGSAYGQGEPAWASREVINAAEALPSTCKVTWWEWKRLVGSREDIMDGFVGAMLVRGDLKPFHPLLALVQVAHIGRGITSGNGLIRIR